MLDVVEVVDDEGVDVVDEEDVDEVVEIVEAVDEVGVEVVDEEESIEVVEIEVVDEEGVEVVDEGALGVIAKYAAAPARTIIMITITAVNVREMARGPLPFKLLMYKVLTGLDALLFVYC